MKLRGLLMVGLLGLGGGAAFAEGGSCPPGYYPVGGQGTQGCAPIPNYNGGAQQQSQQQQAPQPTGYWEKTWGAIAPSPQGGVLGTALGASSKEEAERLALEDCKAKGGGACEVNLVYHNQCAAMVVGERRLKLYGAGTVQEASDLAMSECNKSDTNCRVYYSACTEPVFHRY